MTEYKTKNATVRIHGNVSRENIEQSTIKFLKGAMRCKTEKEKQKTS